MGRLNSYPNTTTPAKNDELIIDGSAGTRNILMSDAAIALAGMISLDMHRNTYRGKNLGTSFTDAQKTAIRSGTFDDLYVGDYWNIGNVIYRIVDIDYWRNLGDTPTTIHHLVIMPDRPLYNHAFNDTNTTVGGYVGSKMYTEGLESAKTTINSAFGSSYILNHREYLTNAVTDGHPSGGAWFDSTVEIPNEIMIYGSHIYASSNGGQTVPNLITIDKTQLAAIRLNSNVAHAARITYWLRDIVSASAFADVLNYGGANYYGASNVNGVRPVFGVHG